MTKLNNKQLTGILVVFGVLIVGLVVGIIVARNNSKYIPEELDCSLLASGYEQKECLREVSNDDDQEMANAVYEEVLDEALNKEEYYFYADTINDRVSKLVADGKCDEAMKALESAQLSNLPADDLGYFYSFARDISMMCDEEMKAEEYGGKYQEMIDSGQIVAPVVPEVPVPTEEVTEEVVEVVEEG